LQYGVPLRDLVNKFAHVRFEPSGFTGNQEIPIAKSIVDYIFRWLGSRFLSTDEKASLGLVDRSAISDLPETSGSVAASDTPSASLSAFGASASLPADPTPPAPGLPATKSATNQAVSSAKKDQGEISGTSEAVTPPPASEVPPTAVDASPKEELAVLATNGHANAHAANGNGKTGNGNGGGSGAISLSLGATKVSFQTQADAPSCAECGSIMVRNGSCYKCLNCGSTSGCS
jgi:ribonucleoside-diphosphate reductase alpha chain